MDYHRDPSDVRPDVVVAGLPCPPFSKARHKNGGTRSTGAASSHPAYNTVMVEFTDYLASRHPLGFLVEEVDSFAHTDARGQSPLREFATKTNKLGYAIRALLLDHHTWIDVPRVRVWIIGVGQELGHSVAADWMVEKIEEITKHRKLAPPTPWSYVVDTECPEERHRRDSGKEL